jgi:hypothetical protein
MIGARPVGLAVAAALAATLAAGLEVALAASSPASSAGPAEVRICAGLDEAAPPGTGPVLLVFFSTDCSVCYDDLFEARYLVDKGRWPVAVVGVAAGPREELGRFLEKHAWTLPVVLDRRKALARRFRVDAVPFKALLLGSETIYRDDPYIGLEDRRKELKRCLTRHFSR